MISLNRTIPFWQKNSLVTLILFWSMPYLKISACRKFLLSLSSIKFVITENMNLTRFETWLTQNLVNFFPEPKVALTKKLVYCQMFEILFVLFLHSINIPCTASSWLDTGTSFMTFHWSLCNFSTCKLAPKKS